MNSAGLTLRRLSFTGPHKETASVDFQAGLNVIYGASETGKSFILETLNFMLGSGVELRDIPERVGYDRVFLGIEDPDGNFFTLERAAAGGQFSVYDGLHNIRPDDMEVVTLAPKHSQTNENNISTFLLSKIGLANKRIRRNKQGDTNALSFRNLAHLCLISEAEIQKEGSPVESGQVITKTPEMATFKFLLSGTDDSAIQPIEKSSKERLSLTAKEEVIDQLIADYTQRLEALVGDNDERAEFEEQAAKLDSTLENEVFNLRQTELDYRVLTDKRSILRTRRENARDRRSEIDELFARFVLLDEHYTSDLQRLEGLREAGALVGALSPQSCPLCGANPDHQHLDDYCDGNIDLIIQATDAESLKITKLQAELKDFVDHLKHEARLFDEELPEIESALTELQAQIDVLSPSVALQRRNYSDFVEKRAAVQSAISIFDAIEDLSERKLALSVSPDVEEAEVQISNELSKHTLNRFSEIYESLLKAWNFPDASRVYFDTESRDFVINGKPRGSRGKGMRAITYAAFSIGLMEFALGSGLSHPGFVILDTPLLAYREPDGDEDDLRGTDVQARFYKYLERSSFGQVIVLENVDPPVAVASASHNIMFSKNELRGRYGFFPL